jgi:hypothetical protein
LLDVCLAPARPLDCAAALDAAARLAADPGHARQRATVRERGLGALVADLGAQFRPAPRPVTSG